MGARGGRGNARRVTAAGVAVALVMSACVMLTGGAASAAPVDSITRVATGHRPAERIVARPRRQRLVHEPGQRHDRSLDADGRSSPCSPATGDRRARTTSSSAAMAALWFTNVGNGSIGRISTAGVVTNFPIAGPVQLERHRQRGRRQPVGDQTSTDTIVRITPTGTMTRLGTSVRRAASSPGRTGTSGSPRRTGPASSKMTTAGVGPCSPASGSHISGPMSITAGPDGALWFVNETARFGRITTAGTFIVVRPAPSSRRDRSPRAPTATCGSRRAVTSAGITTGEHRHVSTAARAAAVHAGSAGPGGNLWFAEDHLIGSLAPVGNPTATFTYGWTGRPRREGSPPARTATCGSPTGHRLDRPDDSGGSVSTYTAPSGVEQPRADRRRSRRRTSGSPTSATRSVASRPAGAITDLRGPGPATLVGIAGGPDGNIWFTASGDERDRSDHHRRCRHHVHRSGIVSPRDITAGPDGNLWFTNPFMHLHRADHPDRHGHAFTSTSGAVGRPSGITAGPDGSLWYVNGGGSIGRITTSGSLVHRCPAPAGPSTTRRSSPGPTAPSGTPGHVDRLDRSHHRRRHDHQPHRPERRRGPERDRHRWRRQPLVHHQDQHVGKITLTRTFPDAAGLRQRHRRVRSRRRCSGARRPTPAVRRSPATP